MHSSQEDWEGGNLGCLGPPASTGKEKYPECLCVLWGLPAVSFHPYSCGGWRSRVLGNFEEVEARQHRPSAWWGGESWGLVPGPGQVLMVEGVFFQKAEVSIVPDAWGQHLP